MTSERNKRAFAQGFVAGFSSPFHVMAPRKVHFGARRIDTLGQAWRDVGKEILEASEAEDRRNGKGTRKKTAVRAVGH